MPCPVDFAVNFIFGKSTSSYRPQLLYAVPLQKEEVLDWMTTPLSNGDGLMHLDEGGTVVRLHADALRRTAAHFRDQHQRERERQQHMQGGAL
jgi:hypothetical protein